MKPAPALKFEARLAEELRQLPSLTAPPTLLPRVLAAIEARATLPWWRQSWWEWPVAARAAFCILALTLIGLTSGGGLMLRDGVESASRQISERLAFLSEMSAILSPLADALALVWAKTGQPLLWFVGGVALATYLYCLGLGTMFYRVACKRS